MAARWDVSSFAGLASFLDSLPFDLWAHDTDNVFLYINATALRRWGPMVGRPIAEIARDPGLRAAWLDVNARALRGEVVQQGMDYRPAGIAGDYLAIVAPVHDQGETVGTLGVNIDLTAQRAAERGKAEATELLQAIFDVAQISIGVREMRGTEVVYVLDNRASARNFGLEPEQLRGLTSRDLGMPEAYLRGEAELFARARRHAGPLTFEVPFNRPEGPRIARGWVAPLGGKVGAERFVVVAEDITESRALEANLHQADRLISMGTLAASVGHELRNPLSYVRLNLEMLLQQLDKRGLATDQALVSHLNIALDGTDRLIQIVGDLQALTRPPEPDQARANLNDVVSSVLTLAGNDLRDQARLTTELGEVGPVRGNPMRLGQLTLNLALNAARAAGERGKRQGEVRISTSTDSEGCAQLTIEDNGPGIAADMRRRLFTPFATTQAHQGGTGLGLFVVRQIADAAGAAISVADVPGGGTLFKVRFASAETPAS